MEAFALWAGCAVKFGNWSIQRGSTNASSPALQGEFSRAWSRSLTLCPDTPEFLLSSSPTCLSGLERGSPAQKQLYTLFFGGAESICGHIGSCVLVLLCRLVVKSEPDSLGAPSAACPKASSAPSPHPSAVPRAGRFTTHQFCVLTDVWNQGEKGNRKGGGMWRMWRYELANISSRLWSSALIMCWGEQRGSGRGVVRRAPSPCPICLLQRYGAGRQGKAVFVPELWTAPIWLLLSDRKPLKYRGGKAWNQLCCKNKWGVTRV